jgi:two-component system chemotaxis sensor kinase CheA
VSEGNVRVDVGLLDKLMNLVGELVLARNQILQSGARIEDPSFLGASQRLNLITTELQEQVMKTRMQPIGNVWSRLPRVVRDLAISCGKQVRIEMSGKETELDRTVLEAIKDPLTHIVRNSVDHGIERPDVRASRSKPKTGTLRLRAFHEGGQVNIEIADDGGGMNLEAIKKKALERGVVTPERVARMNERELMQLVFLPGFSTAEKVTNVSGRGVGMDVVKTNIEKIGGTVDLMTAPGRGTTIRIKIPLTLAIVPALIVSTGGQRYAIPQGSLVELVGLDGEQARGAVEWVHGTPVYRLRGRLLPLVSLNEKLQLGENLREQLQARRPITIVVLSADERQFGLVVDDVRDTEEIVVKPLGRELKGISVFAGATIMGDGRVALILDVMGLAMLASAVGRGRDGALRGGSETSDEDAPLETVERQAWLLFGVDDDGIMAMPLADVARLEEFPRSKLERAGRRSVVQYRGAILPLIHLDADEAAGSGPLSVIVHAHKGRSVGFVVRRIIDVVEAAVRVERVGDGASVLGAAVVQGRVTDLLDVAGAIERHLPEFLEGRAA